MLNLLHLDQVVTNYEALSDKDHADVQDIAYNDDNAYLYFQKKAEEKAAEQGNDTLKI